MTRTRYDRPGGVASSPSSGALTGVVVATKVGGTIEVNVAGTYRTMAIARDLVPAIGDVVLIHRYGSLWAATARLGTASVSEMPPVITSTDPNPTTYTGSTTVLATSTGTYRSGAWMPDEVVRVGEQFPTMSPQNTGTWFWGDKPRSLAGATVTNARVTRIRRRYGPAAATGSTLWLVTESSRPAGPPTLTLSTTGPTTRLRDYPISFTVPVAWVQQIVDGTAGGMALYEADGAPYLEFDGRGTDPTAFTLVIDWTRSA